MKPATKAIQGSDGLRHFGKGTFACHAFNSLSGNIAEHFAILRSENLV
jgi:hypothetical protein